jgi:hypothetical protein
VGFGVRWPDPKPAGTLTVTGGDDGCLQALVLQVALAVTREDTATCNGCGVLFTPTKRPAAGLRVFCSDCRSKGVPQRFASRAHRARKREGSTGG